MSNKSIDGLQRRTSTQGGRRVAATPAVKRRTVKRVPVVAQKTASNQATTRRKIGIPDTKSPGRNAGTGVSGLESENYSCVARALTLASAFETAGMQMMMIVMTASVKM